MIIQILLVRTQNYAYVMVCFSTYVFSMYLEFLPTCPGGHGPRAEIDEKFSLNRLGEVIRNRVFSGTVLDF